MKKILSILMLLVAIVTGAQASTVDDLTAITSSTVIVADGLNGTSTLVNSTLYNGGTVLSLGGSGYSTQKGTSTYNETTYKNVYQIKNNRQIAIKVGMDATVTIYGGTHDSRAWQIGTSSGGSEIAAGENGEGVVSGDVDGSTTPQVVYINATSDLYLALIVVEAKTPAGPTITTQPQSAAYASGDPIAALTVDATASAGTLTYQWYSCDDAEKTNAATIGGATSASYTPTGAGFFFVNVKDDNGNVDSDVAQITVSEAEAPTINVTGAPASDVVVGTEVILTAETTGTPTPTVTWYDGDTDEAITTGASYTVPTDVAGTFSIYAVASNGVEPDATSAVQTIVVKEQVAKPTITPNGAYFEESQEVAIATTTEDATIQYSTDGGSTWNDYTEAFTVTETTTVQAKAVKAGYIDSEAATATFTLVTLDPQVDVTAAASWDWSKFGTKEIKLTDSTTPSKSTEFVLSNAVNYGLCSSISADFGNAQQLKVTTEYVVRDYDGKGKGYLQGGHIKFNTTVPGTVTVTYSNTGNRSEEGQRRFLNVNGSNYGEGTMSSSAKDKTTSVDVAAGEVHIKGTLKSDGTDQYLRIYSIEFTPATSKTITIDGEAGVTTFVAPYDLDFTNVTELSAYAVTVINSTSVTTEKVGKVPAGTALLIKGETAEVPVAESADPITNLLLASTGAGVQGGDNIYAYSKTKKKFCKVASTVTIPVGKAYLNIEANTDALDIDFDGEATGVNGVAEAKAEVAPVKVIKNGKLYIGNYNVAGQLVK